MCWLQFFANLYGIPVPAGEPDPDIFITLEVLGGDTSVGLYCNPGWGQYADVNANYPQPGYAVWQSGEHVSVMIPHVRCCILTRAGAHHLTCCLTGFQGILSHAPV